MLPIVMGRQIEFTCKCMLTGLYQNLLRVGEWHAAICSILLPHAQPLMLKKSAAAIYYNCLKFSSAAK